MTATIARLLETHKSDSTCLARLHAEVSMPDRFDSESAVIGSACHDAAERLTRAAVLGGADAKAIIRETCRDWRGRPGFTPRAAAEVVSIMLRVTGPNARTRFVPESGYNVAPEWEWKLDEDFKPIDRKDAARWNSAAYAGRMDRLEFGEKGLRVVDWKSIVGRIAGWEIRGAIESRIYVLAALAHFPGFRACTFRYHHLRHDYYVEEKFVRGEPWEDATREYLTTRRAARVKALETGFWPETLGDECYFCPVKGRCKATAELRASSGELIPDLPDDELARRTVAVKHLAGDYEREAKARVKKSDAPLPLGDGSVLGKKPVNKWQSVMPYERVIDNLRGFGMTPAQEVAWFRFVAEHNFPGAVKKALYELCGSAAKAMIESDEWVSPYTGETFSVWTPDSVTIEKQLTDDELDDYIDRMLEGG